ncbi:hypothetical protein ACXN5S_03335 [Pseudoroseicyclus sp. H15]
MTMQPRPTYEFHDRLAAKLAEREEKATPAMRRRGNGGGRAILLLVAIAAIMAALYQTFERPAELGNAVLATQVDSLEELAAAALPPSGTVDAGTLADALQGWAALHVGPVAQTLEPTQLLIVAGTLALFAVIFALLILKLAMRVFFGNRHRSIRDMGIN